VLWEKLESGDERECGGIMKSRREEKCWGEITMLPEVEVSRTRKEHDSETAYAQEGVRLVGCGVQFRVWDPTSWFVLQNRGRGHR